MPADKTTDLATTEDAALAAAEDWNAIAREFDDGSELYKKAFGLTIPRLKTDFGKNGRGFVDALSDEAHSQLEIVILAYPPSRSWWEVSIDDGGGGTVPDCSSIDMVGPTPNSSKPQAARCADCKWSLWGVKDDGKAKRPPCAEAVNIIAYEVTSDRFMWLRFSGTSLKPFNQWISYLVSKKLPAYSVTTMITTERHKEGARDWLTAKFAMGRDLLPNEVRPMREIAKGAMAAFEQAAMTLAEEAPTEQPFDDEASKPF